MGMLLLREGKKTPPILSLRRFLSNFFLPGGFQLSVLTLSAYFLCQLQVVDLIWFHVGLLGGKILVKRTV